MERFRVYEYEINSIFAKYTKQWDVLLDLYKLVYDGSSAERPPYDLVQKVNGYPKTGKALSRLIWNKFIAFDELHHSADNCIKGGLWLNRGFSTDESMSDWECEPAPFTLMPYPEETSLDSDS